LVATHPSFIVAVAAFVGGFSISAASEELPSFLGSVRSVKPGILYILGQPFRIAVVDVAGKLTNVAIPSDPYQAAKVDDTISFSGPQLIVAGEPIVDTSKGFVYRADAKDFMETMAELVHDEQRQAEEAAAQGIPNTVQTSIVLTKEQKEQAAKAEEAATSDRRLNYILALLSLVVTVLAFERIPKLVEIPVKMAIRHFKAK
jgi:hypothetical protein